MRSRSLSVMDTSPDIAKQMPFEAWFTGVSRTTSAGVRVRTGAACDIFNYCNAAYTNACPGLRRTGVVYRVMPVAQRIPRPHWYGVPARALFVTFLLTLLSFAVTLLVSIL